MGYPLEFRNNVVRSILSDGTRISDAAKEYQVARVTIYSWLKVARQDAAAVSASNIGTQNMKVPLPEGVDFNKMYDAYVVCRHLGFDSTEAGQYCRREGLLLADVKAFAGRQRKKVLTDPDEVSRMQKMLTKEKGRVKELEANYRLSQREIERKDKVTAGVCNFSCPGQVYRWGGAIRPSSFLRLGNPQSGQKGRSLSAIARVVKHSWNCARPKASADRPEQMPRKVLAQPERLPIACGLGDANLSFATIFTNKR